MRWPQFAAGEIVEPPAPCQGLWRVRWQRSGYVECERADEPHASWARAHNVDITRGFSAWDIHLLPDVEFDRIMKRARPA